MKRINSNKKDYEEREVTDLRPFFWLGLIFIILGIIFVSVPFLEQFLNLADIPWWILLVYKRGSFYFATSPILILVSFLFFLFRLL